LRQIHDAIVTPGRFEMALLHFYSMILLSVSDMHFRIFSIDAITGCDTTSSFFGIGKKSMFKALKETPDQFSDLSMISHADVDDSVYVCRKLISRFRVHSSRFFFAKKFSTHAA
jgi:hypothetical protein